VQGRVLVVAGSDSGGGAGIQADIKTVTALGGFAMTAITALTAQTTEGVFGIHEVPAAFVAEQMRLVLRDIGADVIKLGMLHRVDVIDAVCDVLAAEAPDVPVIVDPVMVAKGGHPLLTESAAAALRSRVVPLARLLTPNLPKRKPWPAAARTTRPILPSGCLPWGRRRSCSRAGTPKARWLSTCWPNGAGPPSRSPARAWRRGTPTAPAARLPRRWPWASPRD
jgi:hypothetical protein